MNLYTLRSEIIDALSTLTGVEVTGYPPGQIIAPHAFINSVSVNYEYDSPDGCLADVEVVLAVGRIDDDSSWQLIDDFLTPGSTMCVRDALNAIQATTAELDWVHCSAAQQVEGNLSFGGGEQVYLAITYNVQAAG